MASITFSSDGVLFEYGSSKLKPTSYRQLAEIAEALKDPQMSHISFVFVDGHTCDIGSDRRNCKLSWARVSSVVDFLVEKGGVPRSKLKPRGFGERDPIVENEGEENRAKNRRVVLKSGFLSLNADKMVVCEP